MSAPENMAKSRWRIRPELLTVAISVLAFVVINFLGYWDVEDLFVSGSSLGAQFGFSTSAVDRTNDLVYSLWGVPLLDFGIVGGYRLPYQGTINTGPFWIFRNLLPVEILMSLAHLLSMIIAAIAFGGFWRVATRHLRRRDFVSSLLCLVCWISLQFPIFEYMLQQDWYTMSIVNQGFISALASLLTVHIQLANSHYSVTDYKNPIRLFLVGCYFLVLGHTGLLAVYGPTLLVFTIFVFFMTTKSAHQLGLTWRRFRLEIALLVVIALRFIVMSTELLVELRDRNTIGTDSWWARPTRSYSDLKHFVGQILGTEFNPWLAMWNSSWLQQFNMNEFSRTPHTAAFATSVVFLYFLRRRNHQHWTTLGLLLGLWMVNFLLMLRILPNIARVPVDYLYRDILIALGMAAVGIVVGSRDNTREAPLHTRFNVWLLATVVITSLSVSISNPFLQWYRWSTSPYSLSSSLQQSTDWIQSLEIRSEDYGKVLAVIDPVFLSRWQDESSGEREWQGLRGFFQLRQAGMKTLEGSPKIRDATAFTGATSSLKQSLEAPNVAFCDPVLFGFLGVSKIIMSPDDRDLCVQQLTKGESSEATDWRVTSPKPLADSGLWIAEFSTDRAVSSRSERPESRVQCGLLADPECRNNLRLAFDSNWTLSDRECKLPCVLRMSRGSNTQVDGNSLITPLNAGNSLTVVDESGLNVEHSTINGLIAIPKDLIRQSELTVKVTPDFRMWLQVANAYAQYILVACCLVTTLLRSWRSRQMRQ